MSADWSGLRIRHRRTKRVGVVVGDSRARDIRIHYDDGRRDTWVFRENLELLDPDPQHADAHTSSPGADGSS